MCIQNSLLLNGLKKIMVRHDFGGSLWQTLMMMVGMMTMMVIIILIGRWNMMVDLVVLVNDTNVDILVD